MPERRFQDIWKEQCEAARGVAQRHGVVSALDYLIGEKLMDYAEMAVTRPEFAGSAAATERFRRLKELLTSTVLGTA
jgi:hypothetical protein